MLGHTKSIFDSGWPAFDASMLAGDTLTVAVQVGGKTRGTVTVAKEATQDVVMAAAMADASIAKFVTAAPKKVIYVPGRLLNIVV